jgi:heme exporter protein A
VQGVDLALAPGERLAVVGPNGAGKTTVLRMVAALLRPDGGSLRVFGNEMPDQAGRARGRIGYLGHQPMVYLDLTAWQNLEFFADLYGVPEPRPRIEALLRRVGLLQRAYDPVREFSRGMAQRLGMARVLLHEPELLLLDEPHVGLDAPGAALLDGLLEGGGGRTVLMVTHDVERAAALSDRMLVMRAGRVALDQPTAGMSAGDLRALYLETVS